MKTILSFLQYSASHETSAQVIWMEGRVIKKTDRSFFIDLHLVEDWQGEGEDIIDIGRNCWHRGRYVERIGVGRLGKNIFASIFCLMISTDTYWQNKIQNGYIYLPIPSELVDDHSLVVDSNWQFSAHNPTCAWSCGQNCSTLVHKVD